MQIITTQQYPFFQYLCLCTGKKEISQIRELPNSQYYIGQIREFQKHTITPYYNGDLEISVTDDSGKSHDLIANVFVNSARVRNLPKSLQDRKYDRIITNTIMEERDSIDGLDKCKKCGSFDQIVKYGYPFRDIESKHRIMTVKDTGRYGECMKCGALHHLSPFIVIDNFNESPKFDISKMKVWDYESGTLRP